MEHYAWDNETFHHQWMANTHLHMHSNKQRLGFEWNERNLFVYRLMLVRFHCIKSFELTSASLPGLRGCGISAANILRSGPNHLSEWIGGLGWDSLRINPFKNTNYKWLRPQRYQKYVSTSRISICACTHHLPPNAPQPFSGFACLWWCQHHNHWGSVQPLALHLHIVWLSHLPILELRSLDHYSMQGIDLVCLPNAVDSI